MIVLALDTATPAVTAGVVEVAPDTAGPGSVTTRSVRVAHDARKHGELLMPAVLAVCAEAGATLHDIGAIVVGAGPGPFTGLRVGMVTRGGARRRARRPRARRVLARRDRRRGRAGRGGRRPLLVATDARRREVYWAAYDAAGARTAGPYVEAPAVLADRLAELGVTAAAGACAGGLGCPWSAAHPGPGGLVACALDALRSGTRPGPVEPLYLRRPDAVEPGPRKPVSVVSR